MISLELSLKQLMDAVKQLSPAEKLELSEMIWEEDISIPMEHQDLVKKRIQKAKEDPEGLLDWDIASKRLRS